MKNLSISQMRDIARNGVSPDEFVNENTDLTIGEERMIDEVLNEQADSMIGMAIAMEMMESQNMEEAINEAVAAMAGSLTDMGIINENISINTRKPKKNVIVLTKDAHLKRLATIFMLKIERDKKTKDFKRFKVGSKIRKDAKANMKKRSWTRAYAMAKKAYKKLQSTPGFKDRVKSAAKK